MRSNKELDLTNPNTALYMGAAREVTAVFAEGGARTLEMLPPDGVGTVAPAPGSWACRVGEQRTLKATVPAGMVFKKWVDMDAQGATLSTNGTYTLTMNRNYTVQAVFAPADVALWLSASGDGTLQELANPAAMATGDQEGRWSYHCWGDIVMLEAKPGPTACFTEWQGDCQPTWGPYAYVFLDSNVYGNQWCPGVTAGNLGDTLLNCCSLGCFLPDALAWDAWHASWHRDFRIM